MIKLAKVALKDPAPSELRRGSGVRLLKAEEFGGHLSADDNARVVRVLVVETLGSRPTATRVSIPYEGVAWYAESVSVDPRVDPRRRKGGETDEPEEAA
jgi:hypothetical protein